MTLGLKREDNETQKKLVECYIRVGEALTKSRNSRADFGGAIVLTVVVVVVFCVLLVVVVERPRLAADNVIDNADAEEAGTEEYSGWERRPSKFGTETVIRAAVAAGSEKGGPETVQTVRVRARSECKVRRVHNLARIGALKFVVCELLCKPRCPAHPSLRGSRPYPARAVGFS